MKTIIALLLLLSPSLLHAQIHASSTTISVNVNTNKKVYIPSPPVIEKYKYYIIKFNFSKAGQTLTVYPPAGYSINGSTSPYTVLVPGSQGVAICDGANWFTTFSATEMSDVLSRVQP